MPAVNKDQLEASLCRDSYADFVRRFWSTIVAEKLVWNWHMQVMCDEIQAACERIFRGERKEYDIVFNVSPGSSKSLINTIFLVPWAWTRMPSFKMIGASYAYSLAVDHSRKTRDVIQSEKYRQLFPGLSLREDQNAKGNFGNNKGGSRFAVGINGSVLGLHGHWIGIDDPLDPNQSVSEADTKAANRWIKETLSSRKTDKRTTVMALTMQRLSETDPTAEVFLKRKRIRHVCLPAELTEDVKPPELAKHYVDGLMDPDRLGREELDEAQEQGTLLYQGQYLQRPASPEGGMFLVKKFKLGFQPPIKFDRIVRGWDKAGTTAADNNRAKYTVGTKMALDLTGRFWILGLKRVRFDSFERERLIEKTARDDGYVTIVCLEQEGGSGGKESYQGTARRLKGFRVRVMTVGKHSGGKVDRADPWSVQVNAGNVYLAPDDPVHPWHAEFISEHRHFPNGRFSDIVDSCSLGFSYCKKTKIRVGGMVRTAG